MSPSGLHKALGKVAVIVISCCIICTFLTADYKENQCPKNNTGDKRKKQRLRELTRDLTTVVELTSNIPNVHTHAKNALARAAKMLREYNEEVYLQGEHIARADSRQHRKGALLDVCPETYLGTSADYPLFEKGRVLTNCTNAPPFPSVISILLNGFDYADDSQIVLVLREIYTTYPRLTVHMAVADKVVIPKGVKLDVRQHILRKNPVANDIWNGLVENVMTDYVLVGRRIERFQWYALLERMVRVVSELGVDAVGGALRTPDGHWSMGCQQTRLRNYTLTYRDGYHMSTNSCAYCDYILSPFVSRTSTLRAVQFKMASPDTVFHDYFLRLQRDGKLVMSCPDTMFYVLANTNTASSLHKQWIPLMQTYALNEVDLHDGRKMSFSCSEAKSSCTSEAGIIQPVCCIKVLAKAVIDVMDICTKLGVFCHLDGGTQLGAIKFNGILPWELDADLLFVVRRNVSFWDHREQFTRLGYALKLMFPGDCRRFDPNNRRCNHFIVAVPGWRFELWGATPKDITDFQSRHHLQATKVYFGGRWLNANTSPGLTSHNRYGYEVLRHAEHWRNLKAKDSWVVYKPSSFVGCPHPGRHFCLDQDTADGNMVYIDG